MNENPEKLAKRTKPDPQREPNRRRLERLLKQMLAPGFSFPANPAPAPGSIYPTGRRIIE